MEKIRNLISLLTLEEKASLCSGKDFWRLKGIELLGIPSIMVTDGPHGLRKQVSDSDHIGLSESVPATCFPTASALAATWNRDLIYQVGEALGEECLEEKVAVILGPGVNIKRSPLCGRNFEYFSEDPYLTGELAKSHIKGVQSKGIGTSLKHFAVNNQEYRRMVIDAIVDERALREIYLPGYEIAVKEAQPWTVMCAYNKINGTYAAEHKYLITDILKQEWGHEGLVVTDWGAMNDRVAGLIAGVELEMPGVRNGNDEIIVEAVRSGELDETVLDCAVERILMLILKAEKTLSADFVYDRAAHHALARRVAGEGCVLLKNENQILPLQPDIKIALVGQFSKYPRYQGAGSSLINPTQLDNLFDEITNIVGTENLTYAPGYPQRGDQVDEQLIAQALKIVKNADVVLISAGLTDIYDVEGIDRQHLKLPPGHNALIEAVADAHPHVIVVLSNGSAIEMPWVDKVSGIVEGYLGGQAGAGGVADILFGIVNPSGKLAETFPVKLEDDPSHHYFPSGPATVEYRESIFVGYRYYDTVKEQVLFSFGFGLSYTTFEYRDLRLSQERITDQDNLKVFVKVKNSGPLPGKEIVQLYVRDLESTVFRPYKELKGFEKVALLPGQEVEIEIELDWRAFAFYSVELKDWYVETGIFEVLVGASSRDIRLSKSIEVRTSKPTHPMIDRQRLAAYYSFPKGKPINQRDFELLYGKALPKNQSPQKGSYSINTSIGDMTDSFIGRQLFAYLKRQIEVLIPDQEDKPTGAIMQAMLHEMPLRSLLMLGDGAITRHTLDALLQMINGKFFKGLIDLLKAIRAR